MKTAAIIAEYNPFHIGHAGQLQDIKHLYGAACIVIMSGNFVQRGTPAMIDKFTRAKWALHHGADIVLELPTAFATAGAEQFAYGACSLLNRLGFIDMLCFGSEITSIQLIETIADILLDPPATFDIEIRKLLHQGKSYAAAREEALYPILIKDSSFHKLLFHALNPKQSHFQSDREAFHSLLSAPNTILGIEYCKALKKLNSRIQPIPMPRKGSSYHDTSLPNSHFTSESSLFSSTSPSEKSNSAFPASASAIRQYLLHHPKETAPLSAFVPKEVLQDLSSLPLLHENNFSSYLYYALLGKMAEELEQYYEVSPDLARRICNHFPHFQDFSSFVEQLKTKQYAHARIQRAMLHILLSISKEEPFQKSNFLRLLALKKEMSYLLRSIPKQTGPIIITKAADASKRLAPDDFQQFEKDIARSQLYGFTSHKATPYQELSVSPLIL